MTDRNKWSIVINGGNNINNYENSFQGNSFGGVINVGSSKTCRICQEIVGLGHSKCQCGKEDNYCEYCQSNNTNEKKCSCWKKNQETPENQLVNSQLITFTEKTQVKPDLKKLVGNGGYGKVYYGKQGMREVAVKKISLSPKNISQNDIKEITDEVNILKKLQDRYIIQYYGVYFDKVNQELLIIMDYAENGTLTKFIDDNKTKEHNWNFNNELIRQMVLGLAYIHSQNIIHRDLKSMNILLTKNNDVKISDFGLSKTKSISSSSQSSHSEIVGTLRWMSPELLKGGKYSEQSDIYALGVIIWEMTAKCTIPPFTKNEKETIPNCTPQNIQNIIRQCWKNNPSERITLANILEIIKIDKVNSPTVFLSKSLEFPNLSKSQNVQENSDVRFSQQTKFNTVELNQVNWGEIIGEPTDWTNINPFFTSELVQSWQNLNFTPDLINQWEHHGFSPSQTHDWLSIGLQPTDFNFAAWLRDHKHLTPEEVLNQGNYEQLSQEFFTYWQGQDNSLIEISPK